jgi:hypothetical protein
VGGARPLSKHRLSAVPMGGCECCPRVILEAQFSALPDNSTWRRATRVLACGAARHVWGRRDGRVPAGWQLPCDPRLDLGRAALRDPVPASVGALAKETGTVSTAHVTGRQQPGECGRLTSSTGTSPEWSDLAARTCRPDDQTCRAAVGQRHCSLSSIGTYWHTLPTA